MPDFDEQKALETFKSLVQISLTGLRTVTLLNGGGAVALLTYFGNLKKTPPALIGIAVGGYALGLVFAGTAFFLSYRTQLTLFQEQTQGRPRGSHIPWLTATLKSSLASLLCFTIGSVSAGLGLFEVGPLIGLLGVGVFAVVLLILIVSLK